MINFQILRLKMLYILTKNKKRGNNMVYLSTTDWIISANISDQYKENLRKYDHDRYIECDDLIAPIISILNQKGYTTRKCCQGRYFDSRFYQDKDNISIYSVYPPYIEFDNRVDLSKIKLPKGWYKEIINEYQRITCYTDSIEDNMDSPFNGHEKEMPNRINESSFIFYKKLTTIMNKLYEWSLSLPSLLYYRTIYFDHSEGQNNVY